MNREQAEQIARKNYSDNCPDDTMQFWCLSEVVAAIMEAVAVEREACANHIDVPWTSSGAKFADAIRARGNE